MSEEGTPIPIVAEKIVSAILKDLRGRKGIGDELDMIEDDIYVDMEIELAAKVMTILNES